MNELLERMRQWRHELHQHPETAFEEVWTSAFVAEKLEAMGYQVSTGIGGTGVVGSLTVGRGTRTIGLRADMDALNLLEKGNPEYKSRYQGKIHGCGHDGHTATLLGAAQLLSERRDFNGTVHLVFQPAEEPGKGARAMLDDGLLERFPMDEIYGLHNMPSLPAGTIHTRTGGIMASEDNFTIVIHGQGGHAASPHLGVDPLVVAAQIILSLQGIVSRNASPLHSIVISCTELHTDGSHNAIPSNVTIKGDTRSTNPSDQAMIEKRMREICSHICAANGASCEFTYTHEFAPTMNWPDCAQHAAKAARKVVGTDKVNDNCEPWMASEDFGVFLTVIPGSYLFLGSGTEPDAGRQIPLHNACYDYNDDILLTGAEFFAELVHERLS